MTYVYKTIASPVGELKLVASDKGLAAILWQDDNPKRVRLGPIAEDPDNPVLVETERQLAAYFAGELRAFTVPLDFKGTDFQKGVWQALLTIPFGETRSYGQIARQLGRRRRFERSGRRTARTRSRSLHHAIGSSARQVP